MNTRRFVSGSSIILAGWLGVTFLYEVPAQRYPKLDKMRSAAMLHDGDQTTVIATRIDPTELPDSISQ